MMKRIQTRHYDRSRVLLLILPALLFPWRDVFAQSTRYVQIAARFTNSTLYSEAIVLPGADSALVLTSFRIPNDLLIFKRSRDAEAGKEYAAELTVSAEIYRDGRKLVEETWRGTHFAATYDQTTSRNLDVEGQIVFALAPGQYGYRLRIADRNSTREAVLPMRPVRVPDFGKPSLGKALFASDVREIDGDLIVRPANLGGDVPYGEPSWAVIPVTLGPDVDPASSGFSFALQKFDPAELEREARDRRKQAEKLRKAERGRGDSEVPRPVMEPDWRIEGGSEVSLGEAAATPRWFPAGGVDPADLESGRFRFRPAADSTRTYLVVIDMAGGALADGSYLLHPKLDDVPSEGARTRFATHWRNMPISLNDIDVAIENLEFIVDKGDVRAMRRGSREQKLDRFRAFWKEKDPTPDTEFNELMSEYYRRIDHAAFAFRTGGETAPNGLRTDRARLYVVNGPPQAVSREFPTGGGVREVWTYDGGREFVFEAGSSVDEFSLVKS